MNYKKFTGYRSADDVGDMFRRMVEDYAERESGFKIRWTSFWGGTQAVHYSGSNFDDCKRMAIEDAKRMGWTPPKWWQWWRWGDTRVQE